MADGDFLAPAQPVEGCSRSILNSEGADFVPTTDALTGGVPLTVPNALRETLPSGTVRFWLLGEIEQGASTMSPVKVMVPSAANAPYDNMPATASDANMRIEIFFMTFPEN